ncbi:MAG: hypothetical protein PHX21_13490 [bacterium]|nr:hypothetical protein [bacterium]
MLHRKVALIILAVMFLGIVTGYKLWGVDRGIKLEKIVDKKGDTLEIETTGGIIKGVYGLKINIEKKYGVSFSQLNKMSMKEIDRLVKNSLEDYKEFININFDELVLRKSYKDSSHYKDITSWIFYWHIVYDQIYRGIPVGTYRRALDISIYQDGAIKGFGIGVHPDINISATPSISKTQAFEIAKKHLIECVPHNIKIDAKEKIGLRDSMEMFILPKADVLASLPEERAMDSTDYYLACRLYLARKKTGEEWEYWVDMLKGNVIYGYRTKSGQYGAIK